MTAPRASFRALVLVAGFGAGITLLGFAQSGPATGGPMEFGEYVFVPGWPNPPASHDDVWTWGTVSGVFAESPDRVFVATRGDQPRLGEASESRARKQNMLLVFNRNGDLIEDWSQWYSRFRQPHSVYQNPYDPERRVWIIDNWKQQIFVFSNDGRQLLMTMGQADSPGTDRFHFGRQADIAWLPDSSFYVADGYDNSRIIKFTKDGQYVMGWGTKGSGPGQFDVAHGIAVDREGRVYVADRENSRVQVFDANGKFLAQWPGIRAPRKVWTTADGFVWVTDGGTGKIFKYDRNGVLQYSFGVGGTTPGAVRTPHQLSVDQEGNLYIADLPNRRVSKYTPKKSADPAKLLPRAFGFAR